MRKKARILVFIYSLLCLLLLFSVNITAQETINTNQGNAESPAEKKEETGKTADPKKESIFALSPGNKIKLKVFGEEDLSGEFEVDNEGFVSIPLIGSIKAEGIEAQQLEEIITEKFKDGYLVNPRLSVEVMNFKPFFILGEVNKPGSYPYASGLTVINAVATAGGYTYRARTSSFIITRENSGEKKEIKADERSAVYPGDTILVEERLF